MHAHPVGHVDRLVGVVHAHVHVDAEDDLLARHELEARDQVAVARARHDPRVLPERERCVPAEPIASPCWRATWLTVRRSERSCAPASDRVLHGRRGDLADALHELRLHLASVATSFRSASRRSIEFERSSVSSSTIMSSSSIPSV